MKDAKITTKYLQIDVVIIDQCHLNKIINKCLNQIIIFDW